MADLEKLLKNLKNENSKDFNGYINELSKEGVDGKDIKLSLLMLFNIMKNQVTIPECLRTAQCAQCAVHR